MDGRERVEALMGALSASDAEESPSGESWVSLVDSIADDLDRDIRWRPIAEAPKDGTWVLVCGPGGKYEPRIAVAHYAFGAWVNADHSQISAPTHFAFITPPEEP